MPLIKSTNTEVKKYLLPFIMLHFEHLMLFTRTDSVPDRYSIIAQNYNNAVMLCLKYRLFFLIKTMFLP